MRLDLRPAVREVALLPFAVTLFFVVSGGPIGLEPLVSEAGPGMALLLILLVPFLYAIPSALMTAELSSAMPQNGGYYVWVKEAFGEGPAFLCGFWTMIYSIIDTALYPVLFAEIVSHLFESQIHNVGLSTPQAHYAVAACVLACFTGVNLLGIRTVGVISLIIGVVATLPFLALIFLGLPLILGKFSSIGHPLVPPGQTFMGGAGAGIAVIVWNYLGWDSLSTVTGEVDNPKRTVPKALGLILPVIVGLYFFTVVAGLAAVPDFTKWKEGFWVEIAGSIGGPMLGLAIAIGLGLSALGQFNAMILGTSRIPQIFAADGLLPRHFAMPDRKLGTPVVPILIVAGLVFFLIGNKFLDLLEADVIVYTFALMFEFAALFWLRVKQPYRERPFEIPGGKIAAFLIGIPPLFVMVLMVASKVTELGAGKMALIGFAFLIAGPTAYGCACIYRSWAKAKREGQGYTS